MLPPYDRIAHPELLSQFDIDRINTDGTTYTTSIVAHSWEPVDDLADCLSFTLLVHRRNPETNEDTLFSKCVLLIKNWYEVRNAEIKSVN